MPTSQPYEPLHTDDSSSNPRSPTLQERFAVFGLSRIKRGALFFAVTIILLWLVGIKTTTLEAHGGDGGSSSASWIWHSTPSASQGLPSQHSEIVSIILMVENNDHGVLDVTRSILTTTVGPYELIAVFVGTADEAKDQSMAIVDMTVEHHRKAKVDKYARGLRKYTSIDLTDKARDMTSINIAQALNKAFDQCGNEHIAVINANEMMYEYGWDRILLTGLKSSSDLFAVSGCGASNIQLKGNDEFELVENLGSLDTSGEDVPFEVSGSSVLIRDFGVRSPMIYSASSLRELGGMRQDAEFMGLGDIDICLRARQTLGMSCGYYPVTVRTNPTWPSVTGSLPRTKEGDIKLPPDAIDLLEVSSSRYPFLSVDTVDRYTSIEAIPRKVEDVPRTLVTGFSGNHRQAAAHFRSTLHFSPYTRFIVYLMKSKTPICLDGMQEEWSNNTEIRYFDWESRPEWEYVDNGKAGDYAWKLQMVEEVIRDYGGLVFWQDAGNALAGDLTKTWNDIAFVGIWSTGTGGTIQSWTHPAVLAYLDVPPPLWNRPNCNGAMIGFNSHDARAMSTTIRPLLACSSIRECVAPIASNRMNHRQDQAALTVYMHMGGYDCRHNSPIDVRVGDHDKQPDDENCEMFY